MRRPGRNQRTRENLTRPLNSFYGWIQYTVTPPGADRRCEPTANKEDWITKNTCVQRYTGCHYTKPGVPSTSVNKNGTTWTAVNMKTCMCNRTTIDYVIWYENQSHLYDVHVRMPAMHHIQRPSYTMPPITNNNKKHKVQTPVRMCRPNCTCIQSVPIHKELNNNLARASLTMRIQEGESAQSGATRNEVCAGPPT